MWNWSLKLQNMSDKRAKFLSQNRLILSVKKCGAGPVNTRILDVKISETGPVNKRKFLGQNRWILNFKVCGIGPVNTRNFFKTQTNFEFSFLVLLHAELQTTCDGNRRRSLQLSTLWNPRHLQECIPSWAVRRGSNRQGRNCFVWRWSRQAIRNRSVGTVQFDGAGCKLLLIFLG
jgi:hypothetical protein